VIAGRQTAGRGRLGREWLEPDRAMFASLAFEPAWPIEAWSLIPLAAGLAARSAIGLSSGVTVGLRWPNDLVVGDGKIGGLLAESADGIAVVGCGINLLWEEAIAGGAALFETDPGPAVAAQLAEEWADRLLDSMAPWRRGGERRQRGLAAGAPRWMPRHPGPHVTAAPRRSLRLP